MSIVSELAGSIKVHGIADVWYCNKPNFEVIVESDRLAFGFMSGSEEDIERDFLRQAEELAAEAILTEDQIMAFATDEEYEEAIVYERFARKILAGVDDWQRWLKEEREDEEFWSQQMAS